MTPEQIDAVETTLASVRLDDLADRFYGHLFVLAPATRSLFPADLAAQRRRFGDELALVVAGVRGHQGFLERVRHLAAVHRRHDVRADHLRVGGDALAAALSDVLGPRWTPDVASSWARAYQLTAEAMLAEMARPVAGDVMPGQSARRVLHRARRGC